MENQSPAKLPSKIPLGKVIRRQVSVPTQMSSGLRRKSQPESDSTATATFQPASGTLSQRQSGKSETAKKVQQMPGWVQGEISSSSGVVAPKAAVGKKTMLGKGRLERGKQISHLGLFPTQFQRQSTSMQAEAGDEHPADLDELISPNPNSHHHSARNKHIGQWRKQVGHISEHLSKYAETHPQFVSQLTACRLDKMIGLKTSKSLQGDQLTISVTFDVTNSDVFDFRTSSAPLSSAAQQSPKKHAVRSNENERHKLNLET